MKDLNDNNNGMKDWSKEILSPMEAWTVASIIACIVVPWGLSKLIQAIFKKRN